MIPIWLLLFTMTCSPQNNDCRPGNGGYYINIAKCREAGHASREAGQITDYHCVRRWGDPR